MREIWTPVAVVLAAIGIGVAVESAVPRSLPPLSSAFVRAVNSTDVTIVPAEPGRATDVAVPEWTAVAVALRNMSPGGTATAAELVDLTNAQYPKGGLVWAVATVPRGGYLQGLGRGPAEPRYNFEVDFVDASTGRWVEAVTGYGAALAQR